MEKNRTPSDTTVILPTIEKPQAKTQSQLVLRLQTNPKGMHEESTKLHSLKTNECPQKRDYYSTEYILQPLIFRGHVSFQGSSWWFQPM